MLRRVYLIMYSYEKLRKDAGIFEKLRETNMSARRPNKSNIRGYKSIFRIRRAPLYVAKKAIGGRGSCAIIVSEIAGYLRDVGSLSNIG